MECKRVKKDLADFVTAYKQHEYIEDIRDVLKRIKDDQYLCVEVRGEAEDKPETLGWLVCRVDDLFEGKCLVALYAVSAESETRLLPYSDLVLVYYAEQFDCTHTRIHTDNRAVEKYAKEAGYKLLEKVYIKEVI